MGGNFSRGYPFNHTHEAAAHLIGMLSAWSNYSNYNK